MAFRLALSSSLLLGLLMAIVFFGNPFHAPSLNVICRLYGLCSFSTPTTSMEPTIHEGAIIWSSAWAYRRHPPRVGDIVIFEFPSDPKIVYAKRIVAVGGQSVQLRDCVLLRDGIAIKEPYVDPRRATKLDSCQTEVFRVPPGQYMVLGDNRDNSYDSRYRGFVPRAFILARVLR